MSPSVPFKNLVTVDSESFNNLVSSSSASSSCSKLDGWGERAGLRDPNSGDVPGRGLSVIGEDSRRIDETAGALSLKAEEVVGERAISWSLECWLLHDRRGGSTLDELSKWSGDGWLGRDPVSERGAGACTEYWSFLSVTTLER